MIAVTFTITLEEIFLPLQLIYGGLISKSLPSVKFVSSFSLSANTNHCRNENEAISVVNEIIMPYVKAERERLKLSDDHPSLPIMDVFQGQATDTTENIMLQTVPANFTHLFQTLDVQ